MPLDLRQRWPGPLCALLGLGLLRGAQDHSRIQRNSVMISYDSTKYVITTRGELDHYRAANPSAWGPRQDLDQKAGNGTQ